jgi:hypothetical protein
MFYSPALSDVIAQLEASLTRKLIVSSTTPAHSTLPLPGLVQDACKFCRLQDAYVGLDSDKSALAIDSAPYERSWKLL